MLEDAKRDVDLSHAKCNFTRRPGSIYHLYKKKIAGSEVMEVFFSMLSPNEWSDMGMQAPDEYLDSYRLEWDMSWTPIAKIEQRDTSRQFDASILGACSWRVPGTQRNARAIATAHLSPAFHAPVLPPRRVRAPDPTNRPNPLTQPLCRLDADQF